MSQSERCCWAFPGGHQIVLKSHSTPLKAVLEFAQDNILYCLCFYVQHAGFMFLFLPVVYKKNHLSHVIPHQGRVLHAYHFSCSLTIQTSHWYRCPHSSLEHPSLSKTACSSHLHPLKMVQRALTEIGEISQYPEVRLRAEKWDSLAEVTFRQR